MKRGGDDLHEYKKALKMAKEAIETICEISEDMEKEYGYSERYSRRDDHDWDERSSIRRYR